VICDNALVTGFALGKQPVDRNIVLDVCRDFALRQQAISARPEVDLATDQRSKNGSNIITPLRRVRAAPQEELGDEESRPRRSRWFG
jgi:hypothetical protein